MASSLDHTYTTEAELERFCGENYVDFRLDDLVTLDRNTLLYDLIDQSTLDVDTYLEPWYLTADLTNHKLARWYATIIFAYKLSQRRGNAAQYVTEYEDTMAKLQEFATGIPPFPGIGTRSDFTPAMSNLTVDERFQLQKQRVQSPISTGGTSSRQDLSYVYPIDWI